MSWQEATAIVDKMLIENESFLSSMKGMGSHNRQAQSYKANTPSKTTEIDQEFLRTTAHTLTPHIDVDLAMFADSKMDLVTAYNRLRDNDSLKSDRGLADIARTPSRNTAAETLILEAAKNFLPPDQFQNAINTNERASDVASDINASQAKRIVDILVLERLHEKQLEVSDPEKPQEKEPPKREYGVLAEIAEGLQEAKLVDPKASDIQSPDSTPAVEKTEKSKGPALS